MLFSLSAAGVLIAAQVVSIVVKNRLFLVSCRLSGSYYPPHIWRLDLSMTFVMPRLQKIIFLLQKTSKILSVQKKVVLLRSFLHICMLVRVYMCVHEVWRIKVEER